MFLKRIHKAMWWVRSASILTNLPFHPCSKTSNCLGSAPCPPISEAGTGISTAYSIMNRGRQFRINGEYKEHANI